MIRRADPAFLPRLESVREQRTFTDPRSPGTSYEFDFAVLRQQSESDLWFVTDRAKRLEEEYVGGAKTIMMDGVYLPVERQMCLHIALLIEAETLAQGDTSWTFPQWVVFSKKSPDLWKQLIEFYGELVEKARPQTVVGADSDESITPEEPAKNA